jgi:hypothetical protein
LASNSCGLAQPIRQSTEFSAADFSSRTSVPVAVRLVVDVFLRPEFRASTFIFLYFRNLRIIRRLAADCVISHAPRAA